MKNPRKLSKIIESDPHAPHFHFIAPEGLRALPFDPNGAIFWKNRYHLFYIFQDIALSNGGHCWGHASSSDLLHWEYHPTALSPGENDSETGIFSGNAFVNLDGVPTISYHGCGSGTCIATAQDEELLIWLKNPANPVIPEPSDTTQEKMVYNVFDPHIWIENGMYYAILGGQVKPYDLRDTAYLFTSQDLTNWKYIRPFYNPNPHWTEEDEDCACPDFFKIGNRWALMCISHSHGARFYLGKYHNGTFMPEEHHRMNWPGGPCFAPESLIDGRGRRIFWTWALDQRKCDGLVPNELGVMTLPRKLELDSSGKPLISPVEELSSLRKDSKTIRKITVKSGMEKVLPDICGDVMEIELNAQIPDSGTFEVTIRRSPDSVEKTVISTDSQNKTLSIDTTHSTLSNKTFQRHPIFLPNDTSQEDVRVQRAPFELLPGETLHMRIFIDKSMLEVFANNRQCITQRIYPTREDSSGVAVSSHGGKSLIHNLTAWQMASANA